MGGFMARYIKKESKINNQEIRARLDQQRNNLQNYQRHIEPALENDRRHAKQLLKEGKREEAKTVLRRKKYREQTLRSSNAQLDRLDQIAGAFELACSLNEISRSGDGKIKRGKWRSIIKRKFKKPQHNPDSRTKLGKTVDEFIEIQVLDICNKKERKKREKVYTKARKAILKHNEIDEAIAQSFKLETGDEDAVHEELEAILNGNYPLPDIDQDINEVETLHGSVNITAEVVVGA